MSACDAPLSLSLFWLPPVLLCCMHAVVALGLKPGNIRARVCISAQQQQLRRCRLVGRAVAPYYTPRKQAAAAAAAAQTEISKRPFRFVSLYTNSLSFLSPFFPRSLLTSLALARMLQRERFLTVYMQLIMTLYKEIELILINGVTSSFKYQRLDVLKMFF